MRRFILGTDWWTDCDDAVALRMLTRAHRAGEICLLGIALNGCMPYSVASMRGFLLADGVSEMPIGIDSEANDFGGNPPYQKRLAEEFAPGVENVDAEGAVRLYRRLLAASDGGVELVEIGYMQVLANLLKSEGDDLSPLDGVSLLREKVSRIWMMAGKWDADGERENNFCRNRRTSEASAYICESCPVPITFLGWEVGVNVISGGKVDHGDHLYRVLCDHGSEKGRHSWDPMLVLLALIGDATAAGYDTVTGKASVDPLTGANYFQRDEKGAHAYVVKTRPDAFYANAIDARL